MEMPLVSVIVPMFNTELYVDELIESVLAQTLENFELIIVDDCSTDNSCAVVESYIPKSGGRLRLVKSFRNEGPGVKRNRGLELSRGKYIFFADSDDMLISNALENFYRIAEKHGADVLHCKRYYDTHGFGEDLAKNMKLDGDANDNAEAFLTDDIYKRLRAWMKNAFEITPWMKFCRRDFLIENDIKFLPIVQEDSVWTFELICTAKKFVMIPNVCYIRRRRENSLADLSLRREINVDSVRRKFERIIRGLNDVDEFMGRLEYFRENPAVRYRSLSQFVTQNLNWIRVASGNIEPHVIYENLREAFKGELGGHDALICFLISNNIRLIKELIRTRDKLKAAEEK